MTTPPEINYHYEIDGFKLKNPSRIAEWLREVGKEEQKEIAILNYIFCSDEYLLDINRKYLQHDYYTDIISFPLKEDPVEGDIFISVDRVRENAKVFNSSFDMELMRVMVHGLLHFLGYDDHNEDDISRIRGKEDHYLERIK
jgi:rRNA maturation RNase YbeY